MRDTSTVSARPLPPVHDLAGWGARAAGASVIAALAGLALWLRRRRDGLGAVLPGLILSNKRFGVLRIMFIGVGLFLGHVLTSLSATGFASHASALILPGVGWIFLYIGGPRLWPKPLHPPSVVAPRQLTT